MKHRAMYRKLLRAAAAVALVLGGLTAVHGSEFQNALAAYDSGDYQRAHRIWSELARSGNPHAQNNLGWLYEHGEGVPRDLEEARHWYQLAAAADPKWQTNLERVEGLIAAHPAEDDPPAVGAEATAFERGLAAYDRGDYDAARRIWSELARAGDADAQNNLGWLYEKGQGVAPDLERARYWYRQAAAKDARFEKNLDRLDALEAPMTATTGSGDSSRERQTTSEVNRFQAGLAAYDRGEFDAAYRIWLALAESGDAHAQNNLGWLYENGQGVPTDLEQARYWYAQAAERNPRFEDNLQRVARRTTPATATTASRSIDSTTGDRHDGARLEEAMAAFRQERYDAALPLLKELAAAGEARAQTNLGYMYANGLGVESDPSRARSWYLAAARAGDRTAQHNLAAMYTNGTGGAVDFVEAYAWFSIAGSAGHRQSEQNRSRLEGLLHDDELERARERTRAIRSALR